MSSDKCWLLNYLSEAISLEAECHGAKTLMAYFESLRIPPKNVPDKFVPPNKPVRPAKKPDPPAPKKRSSADQSADIFTGIKDFAGEKAPGAIFVLIVLSVICAFMWGVESLITILVLVAIAIVVGVVGYILSSFATDNAAFNALLSRHEAAKSKNQSDYEQLCRKTIMAYEKELHIQKQVYEHLRDRLITHNQLASKINQEIDDATLRLAKRLEKMSGLLADLYDMDVIFPKYRNLVAVTSIHEYLDSGRCHQLEQSAADGGAYNLYEDELLHHRIIDKLDIIIQRLDLIAATQYKLYEELLKVNNNIDDLKTTISEGLQTFKHLAELNAHQLSQLSLSVTEITEDIDKGFSQVDEHLLRLDQASDKALAFLLSQRK